jgi:hypothetical protein
MKRLVALGILVCLALGAWRFGIHDNTESVSPGVSKLVNSTEMERLQNLALNGDCGAALQVAHHFSFGQNDQKRSIPWLRIAAKCSGTPSKVELAIYLTKKNASAKEIVEVKNLVEQIRALDPLAAEKIRSDAILVFGHDRFR